MLTANPDARTTANALVGDIAQAERAYRAKVEAQLQEAYALLTEMAYRAAGGAFEELRRRDPTVPDRWTPADWRKFLSEHMYAPGWGSGAETSRIAPLQNENERLRSQVAVLQEQNQRLIKQIEGERAAANTEIKTPSERLAKRTEESERGAQDDASEERRTPKAKRETARSAGRETRSRAARLDPPSLALPAPQAQAQVSEGEVVLLEGIIKDVRSIGDQPPRLPMRFADRLSTGGQRRQPRQLMALYILARKRISQRVEIDALVSIAEGIQTGGGGMSDILDVLVTTHLVVAEKLIMPLGEGEKNSTSLIVWRLSEDGKAFCWALGWEPLESEWERLTRLHEGERFKEHTLGALVVAYQARRRGYGVAVLPEVEGTNAAPDLLLEKSGERVYVEVELGDKEHTAKWNNLAGLQGIVAIVARNEAERRRLVGDCKLKGIPGRATDLSALVRVPKKAPLPEMWTEVWS